MNLQYLLVAIDGTLSKSFAYSGGNSETLMICAENESHVRAFARRLQIPDDNQHVEHGPDYAATGWDSASIERTAWNWLRGKLSRYPDARVVLVGHSRGGHIVASIAIRLSRVRHGDFVPTIGPRAGVKTLRPIIRTLNPYALTPPKPVQQVHFLGLFDAVDMTTALPDTTTVPANVEWFYHALRSNETGSRRAWGNTATKTARPANPQYAQMEFNATHGALGGAFPEDCAGTLDRDLDAAAATGRRVGSVVGFAGRYAFGALGHHVAANVIGTCAVPVTVADNARNGAAALDFVIGGAKRAGLPMQ